MLPQDDAYTGSSCYRCMHHPHTPDLGTPFWTHPGKCNQGLMIQAKGFRPNPVQELLRMGSPNPGYTPNLGTPFWVGTGKCNQGLMIQAKGFRANPDQDLLRMGTPI